MARGITRKCRIPILLAPPDTRPIELGEVWENPVILERGIIVDLPWLNDEGRGGRGLDGTARCACGG